MANETFPNKQDVYVDSCFLVAYFIASHSDANKAAILFAKLLASKNTFNLTALTLDESFMAIVRTLENKRNNPPASYIKNISELKRILNVILTDNKFKFKQYESDIKMGPQNALQNISNFKLKPRDAFHISYMQDLNIKYIVTFDSDYDNVSTITVLNS